MKNILVLMHDDAGQEARFQAAVDLTRALDGHLRCIDIVILPVAIDDYAMLGGSAQLLADERKSEAGNRVRMEARLKAENIPYDWIDASGFLSPGVREHAAMADLIVLNRELDDIKYPDMMEVVGEAVIKTGKPIVAVPETTRAFDAFGTALVAWDGSREAEAALRAAVPLLSCAGKVVILEVDDGSIKVPGTEAAAYLSRHRIKTFLRRDRPDTELPSTVILNVVDAMRASYLVMGGFGHSRFIEAAFGGVTRRMLRECPVPLFLAH